MAQFRDIDTPVRINNDLTVTGTIFGTTTISGSSFIEGGTALSAKYASATGTSINTGAGLTGGGTLAATRTLTVVYGGSGGLFGTATTVARSDHSHSDLPLAGGTMSGLITFASGQSLAPDAVSGVVPTQGIKFSADSDFFYLFMRDDNVGEKTGLIVSLGDNSDDYFQIEQTAPAGEPTPTVLFKISETAGASFTGLLSALSITEGGTALSTKYALSSRNIIAGTGLNGGGTLATDATLNVVFAGNGSAATSSRSDHDHAGIYQPLETTSFSDGGTFIAVRTPVRTAGEYYEFWDSTAGWAGINAGDLIARSGNISGSGTLNIAGTSTLTGLVSLGAQATTTSHAVRADRKIIAGAGLSGGTQDLTLDRTIAVDFGAGGTQVASGNHNHDAVYTKHAGQDNSVYIKDTRSINDLPFDTGNVRGKGLHVDFKANTTIGLSDGGTYTGVLTMKKWTDISGGIPAQLGFTDNGNLWMRTGAAPSGSTWGPWNKIHHDGNLNIGLYVRNDISNQSVTGTFSVNGNASLFVSDTSTATSGNIFVRSGANATIHLDGTNSTRQSTVKSFIDGNGNAYFDQKVTIRVLDGSILSSGTVANLSSTYVNGVPEVNLAKIESVLELGGFGVASGMTVSATQPVSNSVDISGGVVYTSSGKRIIFPASQKGANPAPTTAGQNRIDALYVQGHITGVSGSTSEGIITWLQGTTASSPVPPTVPADGVLLANIFINSHPQGAVSITGGAITNAPRLKHIYFDGTNLVSRTKITSDTFDSTTTNAPISMLQPLKASAKWGGSFQIASGSSSTVWTHNYGNSNYLIILSTNTPNRHVYWSNKTINTVQLNLDDATDVSVNIDAILVAI